MKLDYAKSQDYVYCVSCNKEYSLDEYLEDSNCRDENCDGYLMYVGDENHPDNY